MPKKILYGVEAREALVRGVDFLANAVKVTLGPQGRVVVMSRRNIGQSPQVTKDGVTVSNHCDPIDPFEQLGSDLAREAAHNTVEHAGYGITCEARPRGRRHFQPPSGSPLPGAEDVFCRVV